MPEVSIDAATPLALAALAEITPTDTIGDVVDHETRDDGVTIVRFQTKLLGYVGWFWTVAIAAVDDADPTVLEAELLPGDDALLAPDWVPWSQRLEEYKAHQAAAEAERKAAESEESKDPGDADDEDDDDSGDDSDDDSDDDDDESAYLHSGDVDGVDIDELDEDEEATHGRS